MADEAIPLAVALPVAADAAPAPSENTESEVKDNEPTNGIETEPSEAQEEKVATESSGAPVEQETEAKPTESASDKQATPNPQIEGKATSTSEGDVEMKDIDADDAAPAAEEVSATDAAGVSDKSKTRRKSGGVPEHKNKLKKKASKAKITHLDAQPGDYFYIKLKGHPQWPGIIAAEDMLPALILKQRPVTAADENGVFRPDYADGGKKAFSRTYPVMYLYTNEFSWTPNTDLAEIDWEKVGQITKGMKKDLVKAHEIAAEKHDLEYFRDALKDFMASKEAEAAEKEAKAAAKAAAKTAAKAAEKESSSAKKTPNKAKPRKSLSKETIEEDEDDAEMPDATPDTESDVGETEVTSAKPKNKRKPEADAEGSRSNKKPKTTIKLNNGTPKANGTATPKAAAKSATKPKKKATPKSKEPEPELPKEPELTPEEKRQKKEKEILFLRHKLQKGLLTRDQEPKEDEMKQMSEFVTKLEGYADLEVSIIRATKINKVLKAILKLNTIPKEEEFQFKPRSQTLLDKWNKLLASETSTPAAGASGTNGVKEQAKPESEEEKAASSASAEVSNGVEEATSEVVEEKAEAKVEEIPEVEAPLAESKEETVEDAPTPSDKPLKEDAVESVAVESTT